MKDFLSRQNVDNFRKLLEQSNDEAQRKVLRELLAEEERKQEHPQGAPKRE